MSQYLQGNFKVKNDVETMPEANDDSDTGKFEREAMKRLGGSITFVARNKFVWDGDDAKLS